MKSFKISLSVILGFLISLSIFVASVDAFGQDKTTSPKKDNPAKQEAIGKIQKIISDTKYNGISVKKILRVAKKSTMNFNTYVYIADLVHEFGYHTDPLIKIAQYASLAKVESGYFIQLSELAVMKLSETQKIVDLAETISKLDTPVNAEIDIKIQELKGTADFKTMTEAKVYNKAEIDKILNSR